VRLLGNPLITRLFPWQGEKNPFCQDLPSRSSKMSFVEELLETLRFQREETEDLSDGRIPVTNSHRQSPSSR